MNPTLIAIGIGLYFLTKKKAPQVQSQSQILPEAVREETQSYVTPEQIYQATPEPLPTTTVSTPIQKAPDELLSPMIFKPIDQPTYSIPEQPTNQFIKPVPLPAVEPAPIKPGPDLIRPITAPIAEFIMPTYTPKVEDFPPRTDIAPLPMLHWHVDTKTWEKGCNYDGGMARTVLDPATKKAVRVSYTCPMLAVLDTQNKVHMDFNRIMNLSIITRLPDGRVVY